MKTSNLVLVSIATLTLIGSSLAAAKSQPPPSDEKFIKKAAEGGMLEVQLGELAGKKAKREDVKQFGQQMVTDHSKANDDLKSVAAKKGCTLPSQLSANHQAKLDKFSKLSGEEFDRAYVKDMVADHEKDVAEFEKESSEAKDPDVREFATKTLPTLRQHLEHIKQLEAAK